MSDDENNRGESTASALGMGTLVAIVLLILFSLSFLLFGASASSVGLFIFGLMFAALVVSLIRGK